LVVVKREREELYSWETLVSATNAASAMLDDLKAKGLIGTAGA
jgi:hypothetical protein